MQTFVEHYFPLSLSASKLDTYLARGWFRGGQGLNRLRYLCYNNGLCSPVNIRYRLSDYQIPHRLQKMYRRNQQRFRVVVQPIDLNDTRKQELYIQQAERFEGYYFEDIKVFFFDITGTNLFDTHEVNVFDGDTLVACSFMDWGKQSVASILALYSQEPAYKKYSLGIYTMLLEMLIAQQAGKKYFYPGYILDSQSNFDYKLDFGQPEYYRWETQRWWRPKLKYRDISSPAAAYQSRISTLSEAFEELSIGYSKVFYPSFVACESEWSLALPYPVFLLLDRKGDDILIATYDLRLEGFALLKARILGSPHEVSPVPFVNKYAELENFFNLIAIKDQMLHHSTSASELAQYAAKLIRSEAESA